MAGALAAIAGVLTIGWSVADGLDVRPVVSRDLKAEHSAVEKSFDKINDNFKVIQAQIETLTTLTDDAAWTILNNKLLQNGSLEFVERQRYCALSRKLGYVGISICGF